MREDQIKKIDEEIFRLQKRNEETEHEIDDYITGRIDALKWCKGNI